MKPVVKYVLYAAVAAAIIFAGTKMYKNYKAKQAAAK
jgi:hypothetical protein